MTSELIITKQARRDIERPVKSGNKAILLKLEVLLTELTEHPFTGTGKPEPLKFELSGFWSRRINKEHRLVYEVIEPNVVVVSAFGHYE